MKPYLAKIDDNTPGPRNDVTPLFADREAFAELADDLAEPFAGAGVDAVAAIDALGFILGTAIAERLGVGVVAIRKGGKLPVETIREAFIDYSGNEKTLEIRPDLITPGMKVLVADEWVETGAQVTAAVKLVERLGATVAGIVTICMDRTPGTRVLEQRFVVQSVWDA